jgi:hypothetical protein
VERPDRPRKLVASYLVYARGAPLSLEKWATVEIVLHLADKTLERFAMQALPEEDVGPLEEHLLICPECREQLQGEIDFVKAMREAGRKIREQERREGR